MVIGVHYNLAALGQGLSGCVVDLKDNVAVKAYHSEGLHEPRLHRDREAHFLRELENTDLNSPQYIAEATHSDLREPAIPILTMSVLNSQFRAHDEIIIENLDRLGKLGHVLGMQLTRLHALKPKKFHEDGQKSVLQLMIEQTRAFDVNVEKRQWFYSDLASKLAEIEKQVCPVFCHGDFNLANIGFVEGTSEPEALIDFAYSGYGMPETDFVYMQEPEMFEEAVKTYYQATGHNISPDRLKMASLVNNVRAMITFEHYLAQDLSEEDRQFFEDERQHAHHDVIEATGALGIVNFVFAGSPPSPDTGSKPSSP